MLSIQNLALELRAFGVRELWLFGSAARGEANAHDLDFLVDFHVPPTLTGFMNLILREDFGAHSDVDLLVVFDRSPGQSAFAQFFDFKEALEALLKREVDLVSGHSIHNPFFQDELNKTKQTLYAA